MTEADPLAIDLRLSLHDFLASHRNILHVEVITVQSVPHAAVITTIERLNPTEAALFQRSSACLAVDLYKYCSGRLYIEHFEKVANDLASRLDIRRRTEAALIKSLTDSCW
jgi:hypothetical protein